tara:strand:- start:9541 stop:9894 length:354 start_codon:yes stop_codon:yes gene_type:complete
MGKKRRLNSAKAKFAAKHASHPRARLLANTTIEQATNTETTSVDAENISEKTQNTTHATLTPKEDNIVSNPTIKSPTLTTKTAPKTTTVKKTTKKAPRRPKKTTSTAKSKSKSKKES